MNWSLYGDPWGGGDSSATDRWVLWRTRIVKGLRGIGGVTSEIRMRQFSRQKIVKCFGTVFVDDYIK